LDTLSLQKDIDTVLTIVNNGSGSDTITVVPAYGIIADTSITITPSKCYAAPQSTNMVRIQIRTSGLRSKTYFKYFTVSSKFFENIVGFQKQIRFTLAQLTGFQEPGGNAPRASSLGQNYPNPFNPTTAIKYQLPEKSLVDLKVFNLLGKEMTTLVHGERPAGVHEVIFDASNYASGIYFYRMIAGNFMQTKRLMLVK
ncbi:MAG: T9SS C-terminal target domain-containing protein, partial [Ignavibacteriae bacterium]